METAQIVDIISEHLQEANNNDVERLKRIDEILEFVNYNRRLTMLTDEEKQDFIYCNEGYPRETWTEDMIKAYDNAPDQKARDYYIEMWARSTYFRQCAWHNYLFGHTDEKPFVKKAEAAKAA